MTPVLWFAFGAFFVVITSLVLRHLTDFKAQEPSDYRDAPQRFDLREQLDGPIVCEGVIYGPTGRVSSRFTGDFYASWTGNKGVMTEHFTYHDGSVQDREWRLSLGNDGRVKAEADDLVGTGEGEQCGDAFRMRYRIRLPESSGGHVLDTVDWMYLTPSGALVNRSQFRKYGIKVAELVATMQRKDAA